MPKKENAETCQPIETCGKVCRLQFLGLLFSTMARGTMNQWTTTNTSFVLQAMRLELFHNENWRLSLNQENNGFKAHNEPSRIILGKGLDFDDIVPGTITLDENSFSQSHYGISSNHNSKNVKLTSFQLMFIRYEKCAENCWIKSHWNDLLAKKAHVQPLEIMLYRMVKNSLALHTRANSFVI